MLCTKMLNKKLMKLSSDGNNGVKDYAEHAFVQGERYSTERV